MWTILICLGITIILTVLMIAKWADKHDNLSMFIVSLLVMASLFTPIFIGIFTYKTIDNVSEQRIDIVAIKDNTLVNGSISGGIFVVGGYIQETPVYFFYKKSGNGYIQDYIDADGVIIYEDTEGSGYISIIKSEGVVDPQWKAKYLHWLVFTSRDYSKDWQKTEIHVPTGTIIKDFVLDAE